MFDALAALTGLSNVGTLAALLGAFAAFVIAVFVRGRASGKEAKAHDALDRVQDGQTAVARGRATGESPDEALRRNDGAWQ